MKRIIPFLLILLSTYPTFALGEWTDYMSFSSAQKVVLTDNKVYCVTTGGIFTYNKLDNSLYKLTGINGLSDVGIQTAGYGEDADVVIVAYNNSNLDLIYNDEIFNLSAIKRKQLPADKTIYNILFVGQTAYLSCGFGIVAINLEKKEIKDTYYIGENGSYVVVLDMTFDGQFLYAATENGIYKADINSSNLQDFHNWEKVETIPHANEEFDQLAYFGDEIIANYNGGTTDGDELYKLTNEIWSPYLPALDNICDLQVAANKLVVSCSSQIDVYDLTHTLIDEVTSYQLPSYTVNNILANSALVDEDGIIWVADDKYALIKKSESGYHSIMPEGPADNNVFTLTSQGSDIWLAPGGRTSSWNNMFSHAQIQEFKNGEWTVYNGINVSELANFHDIVCITIDPHDANHIFAGSWGGGIFEFQDGEFINRYHNYNSSLQTALEDQPDEPYVRISDMDYDSEGNLWVTNSIVGKPLSVLKTNGEWESFALSGIQSTYDVGQMVITEDDDQWIVIPRGRNLAVRKADGSDYKRLSLISYFTNGTDQEYTSMNDIYSIALDQEGAVWVGTSVGVAVFLKPDNIWTQSPFYASQPGLDENDGIYHPLLRTETITAIAVDGANRKWFGTKDSGVYLISENGEKEIQHFTSSNSPLLADEITSIAINEKNGEVFIGTVKGLISYMGEATAGYSAFSEVYAFPNPVREDYEGDVVIKGLMEDTDVKITDISGNLVYETTSLGGQAIWNGRNLRGNRVSTGVYMVFGNDPSGEQTLTTKILFIH